MRARGGARSFQVVLVGAERVRFPTDDGLHMSKRACDGCAISAGRTNSHTPEPQGESRQDRCG
jgi:hypothetical protein